MAIYNHTKQSIFGNVLHEKLINVIMALITLSGKCPYPVGWHIQTDDAEFNPNAFYSGTRWERIKGRVLVGVDESQTEFEDVGKTGGNKTNKHNHYTATSFADGGAYISTTSNKPRSRVQSLNRMIAKADNIATGATREDSTYDETIDIMNPYRTTYMWVRVE